MTSKKLQSLNRQVRILQKLLTGGTPVTVAEEEHVSSAYVRSVAYSKGQAQKTVLAQLRKTAVK